MLKKRTTPEYSTIFIAIKYVINNSLSEIYQNMIIVSMITKWQKYSQITTI